MRRNYCRNMHESRTLVKFLGIVVYGIETSGWQLITINFVGGLFTQMGV